MSNNNDLVRVLSRKDVLVLAFGAMIGWGWVVLAGTWVQSAGSLGAMLAFGLGGLMVVLVGLTYAELAAAMPKVGGEHVYTFRGLGVAPSFIATWAIILGYVSVIAFEAVALPTVVEHLFPNYKQGFMWEITGYEVYFTWVLVGVAGNILVAAVNYFGVRPVAFFQAIFTALVAIVGIMFISGSLFSSNAVSMDPLMTGGMVGFFAVLVMTPFMFVGFDVIPQAAEEINLPYKKIGLVLIFSVILAVVWYIGIIFGVGRGLTPEAMQTSTLSTADAMAALFGGQWAGNLMVLAGIAGIMTSWNAFYVGGSRAMYAMAKGKMLPEFLAYLHPKYKTPTNAIILIAIPSTLAPLLGRPMLIWLVEAGGLAIVVSWLFVAISFVALRKREPGMERPFKVAGGNLVGYLAIIFSIFFIALTLPGMPAALGAMEWLMVLGWSVLGLVLYLQARSKYGINAAYDTMTKKYGPPAGK